MRLSSIDGFERSDSEAFRGYSKQGAERVYRAVDWLADRLGVEVIGLENIPKGRGLIVANHTFGWDIGFAANAIHRDLGRVCWTLGEHAWWRFPILRRIVASAGVVDGTPENAVRLLEADQLVLVLPGGLREAMKPRELRHRMLWGKRFGFVRTAILTQSPIVPLAAVGADDAVELVGNPFARGKSWLGKWAFPIPRPAYGLPWVHRVKLRYIFGEPLPIDARPDQADDPQVLRRVRLEVVGAVHELIDNELARRAGFVEPPPEKVTRESPAPAVSPRG